MRLSVVMASLNEEAAIGNVIEAIRKATSGKAEIVVVDSSTDRTAEIAQSLGAVVIKQERKGYGPAVREALLSASGDVIVTVDCDNTYPAYQITDLVKLIEEGWDVVGGSRLAKGRPENMPLSNWLANWAFALIARIIYGVKTTDVTTGMRAYRREVVHSIQWESNYVFPAELLIKSAQRGYRVTELPIDYFERLGQVKLHRLRSGMAFLRFLFLYRWKPDICKTT